MPAEFDFDVIVYGTVCLDLMWRVARLAPPGAYEPIIEERKMIGGEAANTAIALSRWGVRVALIGTAMGNDADGSALRGMFAEAAPRLDIAGVRTVAGARTPYCACIATPDGHRTMYGCGFDEMQVPVLDPETARRARIFTMDPNAYQSGLAACATAAECGASIIAMDYTRSPDVNRVAAVSVTSHEQIESASSPSEYAAYSEAIRETDGCTCIVTCGDSGSYLADSRHPGERARHIPAYVIPDMIDSTGAGDVFRAGLIYGQLREWEILRTVQFASAAAGLNCGALGGWGGVRTIEEIEAFQANASRHSPPSRMVPTDLW